MLAKLRNKSLLRIYLDDIRDGFGETTYQLHKRFIDNLIEWKNLHEGEDKECRDGFERMSEGDYSMFEKLFSMAVECIPVTVIKEFQKL